MTSSDPVISQEAWVPPLARRGVLAMAAYFCVFAWLWPFGGWPPEKAVPAGVLVGFLASYWAFRELLRDHHAAHFREARRLGYAPSFEGSPSNPLDWFGASVRTRVTPPSGADPEVVPWDIRLIVAEGHMDFQRHLPRWMKTGTRDPLYLAALAGAGLLNRNLNPWAASLPVQLAGIALLGYALFLGMRLLRREAWLTCNEDKVLAGGRIKPFMRWRGWTLVEQRRQIRDARRMRQGILRVLRRHAQLERDATVLEVGAGAGMLWEYLPAAYRANWVQTDLEYLSLRYAQSYGFGRHWVAADGARLPFKDRSFDAVVAFETLDAVLPADLYPILDECRRVLKPTGALVHLVDFFEFPGRRLVDDLNAAAKPVLGADVAAVDLPFIVYRMLSAEDAAKVDAAARTALEDGREHDHAMLRLLMAAKDTPKLDWPQQAFMFILRLALEKRGWLVWEQGPSDEEERYKPLAYLVAHPPV